MGKQTFVTDMNAMQAKQKCLHYFIALLYIIYRTQTCQTIVALSPPLPTHVAQIPDFYNLLCFLGPPTLFLNMNSLQ